MVFLMKSTLFSMLSKEAIILMREDDADGLQI